MFCPECGKTLAATKADPSDSKVASEAHEVVAEEPAQAAFAAADVRPNLKPEKSAPTIGPDAPSPLNSAAAKSAEAEKQGARRRTRETLHRASNVARGAIEDNVKRVEKIHHVSSVMFEEAHYDPSLRFVLVALGLFVVFIILLVLSKVMG